MWRTFLKWTDLYKLQSERIWNEASTIYCYQPQHEDAPCFNNESYFNTKPEGSLFLLYKVGSFETLWATLVLKIMSRNWKETREVTTSEDIFSKPENSYHSAIDSFRFRHSIPQFFRLETDTNMQFFHPLFTIFFQCTSRVSTSHIKDPRMSPTQTLLWSRSKVSLVRMTLSST